MYALLLGFLGSFLYRARGTDSWTIFSRSFERWLISFLVVFISLYPEIGNYWQYYACFLVALGITYLGVSTGHGSYYHIWYNDKIVEEDDLKVQFEDDERLAPVVRFLLRDKYKPIDWQYKAVGLALTGLLMTISGGVCLIILGGSILSGVIIALSGLLKTPSYALGNLIRMAGLKFQKGTQWGEWIFGFVIFFILGLNL